MQLLIFVCLLNREVAIKITLSPIDSLNIIPFQKYIVKRFFQKNKTFLKIFLLFFKAFLFYTPTYVRVYYIIYVARPLLSTKNESKPTKICLLFHFLLYFVQNTINGNRRRFYSSQSIFYCFAPSKNTSFPYNRAPSCCRNQGTPLRPYTPLQVLQIVFRTPCICTVKKAFSSPQNGITPLLYS